MHEAAQLSGLGKPQHRMHVIRHQYKPHTTAVGLPQQVVEHAQNDPLRLVMIEQSTTAIHRERHEVSEQCIVDNPAFGRHALILSDATRGGKI